jgi:hypothetical protein
MKVFSVDFSKGYIGQNTRGWVCRVYFKTATTRQFTDETHQAHAGSRFALLALWKAWRAAKALHATLAAKPGERGAIGWAD